MIEVHELSKRYGCARVLDDVTFDIPAGEVVALIGPNGAGKTTLLKCLVGLVRYGGSARIGGLDTTAFGKDVRRMIGYLPQAPAFPSHLSVGDALEYYADLRGLHGEDIDARLDALGLTAHAGKRVGELSGGLRQRLCVTVALLGDPPVLLMDEPVANLDPEGRDLFTDLVARLHAAERTIVLSTHVFDILDRVSERVIALVDGRVAYDGPAAGLVRLGRQAAATPPITGTASALAGMAWHREMRDGDARPVAAALEALREEVIA